MSSEISERLERMCGDIVESPTRLASEGCDYDRHPDGVDEDGTPLDLDTYLSENLDMRFTVDDELDYLGASITMVWGGPNVYLDTMGRCVKGYWGGDEVTVPIPSHVLELVDDWCMMQYELRRER